MASKIIWGLGLGLSIVLLVVTAAGKQFYLHMAIAAVVSISIALASYAAVRTAEASSTGGETGVGLSLRHMGYVWAWGTLGLLVTYAFGFLTWREWWQFCIAFALLAGLSLFLAATVSKDTASGVTDPVLLKVARGFSLFILIAMVITMLGLLIDGKMWRFFTVPGQRPGSQDWGANNIFFFGALALAAISANVVRLTGAQQAKAV